MGAERLRKKGWIDLFLLALALLLVAAPAGNECGVGSPCACGAACQGQFDPQSNGYNTIDSCIDGSNPKYEWVEDLTVTDLNDDSFNAGDAVEVDAYLKCDSGEGDEYSVNYDNGSGWHVIDSGTCNVDAYVHFKTNISLDPVTGTHAMRAVIAWSGVSTGMECGFDYDNKYSDTDDITFVVEASPDVTPPSVTLLSPVNESLPGSRVDFNFTVTDDRNVNNCTLYLNSSAGFSANTTLTAVVNNASVVQNITLTIPDGSYLWNIFCMDLAGNSDWYTNQSFVLDATAPTVSYLDETPSSGSYLNLTTAYINISVVDPHIDTLILEWNGTNESSFASAGNGVYTAVKILLSGTYSFRVVVNDTFGHVSSLPMRTAVFDNVQPGAFSLTSPANGSTGLTAESLAPLLDWTDSEESYLRNYTIVASTSPTFTYINHTYHSLPSTYQVTSNLADDSDWYWRVTAVDFTGNSWTSDTFVYHTQAAAPSIVLSSPSHASISAGTSTTLSFMPGDDNLDSCTLWTNITGLWTANQTNSSPASDVQNQFVLSNLSEGSFIWNVLCNDTGSQEAFAASNYTFVLDRSPPLMAYGPSTPVDGSTVTNRSIAIPVTFTEPHPDSLIVNWNSTNQTAVPNPSSPYTFNVTVPADGYFTYQVFLNDSAGNANSTALQGVYVDTVGPTLVNGSVLPSLVGISALVNCSVVAIDQSVVSSVLAQLTWPNSTMENRSLSAGWSVLINASVVGDMTINFCAVDANGLSACGSSIYNLTVVFDPPAFSNITYSPVDPDDLDPGTPIIVRSVVSSVVNLSQVNLRYRKVNESSWVSVPMALNSTSYNASFTPDSEGNWSFSIWANNSLGQENVSVNTTLVIENDRSWSISPAGAVTSASQLAQSGVNILNLTINNTGDSSLVFNISQSSGSVTIDFNVTDLLTVPSGGADTVSLSADIPGVAGSYLQQVFVDALNGNAVPSGRTLNVSIISYSAGPYLDVSIVDYDPEVTSSGNIPVLRVRANNLGNESCTGANVSWILPSGWTTRDSFSEIIGTLGVGSIVYQNISSDVGASGQYTLTVIISCDSSQSFNDSRTITVSDEDISTPEQASTGGSGGGGSIVKVPVAASQEPDLTLVVPERIVSTISSNASIGVVVSNPQHAAIENISLDVRGYFATRTKITPKFMSIAYAESGEFLVSLEVPGYESPRELELTITATGTIGGKKFSKSAATILVIAEESTQDIALRIDEAASSLDKLAVMGVSVEAQHTMLEQALAGLDGSDVTHAVDLVSSVEKFYQDSAWFLEKEDALEADLRSREAEGMDVSGSRRLMALARDDFIQGNPQLALETLEKAGFAGSIEVATEQANVVSRFAWFIQEHSAFVLILLISVIVAGLLTARYIILHDRKSTINSIREKEQQIYEQMKRMQRRHFVDKLIGPQLYEHSMKDFRRRMAALQNKLILLVSRGSHLRKKTPDILMKEFEHLKTAKKELHHKFYVEKTIAHEAFHQLNSLVDARLSRIEEELKLHPKELKIPKPPLHVHTHKTLDHPARHTFYAVNGSSIKTLGDLLKAIDSMDDEQFAHHVNDEKNDFVAWAFNSLDNPRLAAKIKFAKSRKEIKEVILSFAS